jgi:hypothetical protein
MRPTKPLAVNHSAPSGPAAMPSTRVPAPVTGNSLKAPPVVTRPIRAVNTSVNHRAPSGPVVMSAPGALGAGIGNSVIVPPVAIRPIFLPAPSPLPRSVNHSAPSGPAVMANGALSACGSGNSVIVAVAAGGARRKVASATESASIARLLRAGPTGRPYAGRRQRCKRVE